MTAQATAAPRTKQCPFCAETVRAEAVKCRYCGSNLIDTRSRLRTVAGSPVVAVASLIFGAIAATTEGLGFFGIDASFFTREEKPADDPLGFGPPTEIDGDDVRLLVLVAAVGIGIVGFVAALLVRRRPRAATVLFFVGASAGLAVSLVAGINLAVLALSVALLLVAIFSALAAHPLQQ